jgi:transposase-like protein
MESIDPQSLQEAIQYFSDPDNCLNYIVARRWPSGVVCPTCGRTDVSFVPARRVWQCKTRHAKCQFSVKVGTIFEDSALGLDKWLPAMWLLVSCKNGISSYEVARHFSISQKSAWHMIHRIRHAVHAGSVEKLSGHVEADESFIGGKARDMRAGARTRKITGTGGKDKAAVMGILERGGRIHAAVVPNRKKKAIQAEVREHVEAGSALYRDVLKSYEGLNDSEHQVVNHAVEYVRGKVHTNGLENFWSLLKRGLNGTYVSVEPFHLFRYLDEQTFRFNNRKDAGGRPLSDASCLDTGVRQIIGKRLTWNRLTGEDGSAGSLQ